MLLFYEVLLGVKAIEAGRNVSLTAAAFRSESWDASLQWHKQGDALGWTDSNSLPRKQTPKGVSLSCCLSHFILCSHRLCVLVRVSISCQAEVTGQGWTSIWAHTALVRSGIGIGEVKLNSYYIAQLQLNSWERLPAHLLTLVASLEQRQIVSGD